MSCQRTKTISLLSIFLVLVFFQNCNQNSFQARMPSSLELRSETQAEVQQLATKGRSFYLNPSTGRDTSNGSITTPWKTLNKVITSVAAGDTVYIRGGIYTKAQFYTAGMSSLKWAASHRLGKAGAPITVQPYPGEKVIIDGTRRPYFIQFVGAAGYSGHYVVIRGLEFQNFQGIAIGGTDAIKNIAIDGCQFRNFLDQDSGGIGPGLDAQRIIIRNSRFINMGVASQKTHSTYITSGTKKLLVDGNYFQGTSGYFVHGYGHNDSSRSYEGITIRRNVGIKSGGANFLVGYANTENTYIYQNTVFSTHNPYPSKSNLDTASAFTMGPGAHKNFNIKNNIGYGPMGLAIINAENANIVTLSMTNNLFLNTSDQNETYKFKKIFYSLFTLLRDLGYGQSSLSVNPRFASESKLNLSLSSSSPAIDKGAFLTRVKSSGSGRLLPVVDSRYFNDGFGMLPGDLIRVGTSTARITSINSTSHVLTLDRNLEWSSGQTVSLPYKGTAPDMGAYEF